MLCTLRKKVASLVVSGLLLAVLGLTLYFAFPVVIDKAIKKKLVLKEGSETYKIWQNIPVPIYIEFYFFNVTNPEQVWALTHKPKLEEMGPYTFRESREKENITWHENGTLSYRQVKRWYFQSDRSNGSLDDIVTTLNVPMVAAAVKVRQMDSFWVYLAIEELFSFLGTSWFIKKPVRELLFEGYDDKLMTLAKRFMHMPYDKFGWFYERNGTDDGEILAYTGETDIHKVDEIIEWKGSSNVSGFDAPCNEVKGSAGDIWPSDLKKNQKVSLFVTDICRSLSFTYLKETSAKDIKAYRYWADETQLDNGKIDPENKCFCPDGICIPAGATNVSACKFEAPAVVSYPHFLYADDVYRQGVGGLTPDPEKHRMFLDLVPEMGIPLGVAARMQINIVFEGIHRIKQFKNITKRTYFPILWFSETADITDDLASQLKLVLNTLPLVSTVVSFFLVTVGLFLMISALVLAVLYSLGKLDSSYSSLTEK